MRVRFAVSFWGEGYGWAFQFEIDGRRKDESEEGRCEASCELVAEGT